MLICKVIHTSQCPDHKGRVGYFWLIVRREATGKLQEVEESPALFANERRCTTAGERRLKQLEVKP